ncbi:hypothetical protein LX32DRAFT_379868 [Colletotrichum zoysiae]|uniref:Uncharacterized protein n=1 Tax=Colletotrichum zoysiae TaxID=1216348 RepID=A0AAD9HH94_9PEZI|nr:hypothetical protein LX32DRAFT_379868 [Colletotrichum zoysiae]
MFSTHRGTRCRHLPPSFFFFGGGYWSRLSNRSRDTLSQRMLRSAHRVPKTSL